MDEDIENLIHLKVLSEMITQCISYEQHHALLGGHRGGLDSSLTMISNDIYNEISSLESQLKSDQIQS